MEEGQKDRKTKRQKDENKKRQNMKRQKDEKTEKFERLNCISANSNDRSSSLNHIFLKWRLMKKCH